MRVAVISDIHGNLPALEAVLSDVSRERVDRIISCGDVASGPLPVETLQVLRGLADARFVRGNADRALVAGNVNHSANGRGSFTSTLRETDHARIRRNSLIFAVKFAVTTVALKIGAPCCAATMVRKRSRGGCFATRRDSFAG